MINTSNQKCISSWLLLPQNLGTVVIVLHGVLYKAEAVNVTDKGMAIRSQKVETAHSLLEGENGYKTYNKMI